MAFTRIELNQRIRDKDPIRWLLYGIKSRCKYANIPFDITSEDIEKPTHCPVFGYELNYCQSKGSGGNNPPNTASIDRIIPELGYVKGNVMVISWRANEIKKDATFEELHLLSQFYKDFNNDKQN